MKETCGYYNEGGQVCDFTADTEAEMVAHLIQDHGTQEANEYIDSKK